MSTFDTVSHDIPYAFNSQYNHTPEIPLLPCVKMALINELANPADISHGQQLASKIMLGSNLTVVVLEEVVDAGGKEGRKRRSQLVSYHGQNIRFGSFEILWMSYWFDPDLGESIPECRRKLFLTIVTTGVHSADNAKSLSSLNSLPSLSSFNTHNTTL